MKTTASPLQVDGVDRQTDPVLLADSLQSLVRHAFRSGLRQKGSAAAAWCHTAHSNRTERRTRSFLAGYVKG